MKGRDVAVVVLLAAILLGVILVLAKLYSNGADKKELEDNLIVKIQNSNLTSPQKQEVIAILQRETDDSNGCRGTEPAELCGKGTTCTANSQCRVAEICFVLCNEMEGLVTGTPSRPGKCLGTSLVDCPDGYYSTARKECTTDSDCPATNKCFECHGNVANQDAYFQKYCMTESDVALEQAKCAAM